MKAEFRQTRVVNGVMFVVFQTVKGSLLRLKLVPFVFNNKLTIQIIIPVF